MYLFNAVDFFASILQSRMPMRAMPSHPDTSGRGVKAAQRAAAKRRAVLRHRRMAK